MNLTDDLDDLLGDIPEPTVTKKEESIEDLLENLPKVNKATVPKTRSLSVPESNGPWIAFLTRLEKKLIVGRGEIVMVITDPNGKLHYIPKKDCHELPEGWKDGDFVPKF